MIGYFRHVIAGAIAFALTIIIATIGYEFAGWSLMDALYMTVITIYGVGYGEVHPLATTELKVFTMFIIVAGYTSVVYIVGALIQVITNGDLQRVMSEKKLQREIGQLKGHTVICGFGRIGRNLAMHLALASCEFVVVDNDEERVNLAKTRNYLVVEGSATDENALERAGIQAAKTLATTLPDDAANVFITLTARGLNPELIILARGELPTTEKKLRQAGANDVVLPAVIGAKHMAHLITHPSAMEFIEQREEREILADMLQHLEMEMDDLVITETSPLVGKSIGQIKAQAQGEFIVVALGHVDAAHVSKPSDDELLAAGDKLVLLGHSTEITGMTKKLSLRKKLHYRGARS